MSEGLVIDIHRCAMHDGEGIRSVVFLKGCPLHCAWCCNPESMSVHPQLFYRKRQCIGCLSCVGVCPSGALSLKDGAVSVDFSRCVACGKCSNVCPSGAIGLYGRRMRTSEVMNELKKDSRYYLASGGGVTLSGGEVLLQYEFATELLKACKEEGWNTAVETTGYVSRNALEAVYAWTDTFLFDYKMSDEVALKRWTGADKAKVLSSLEYLSEVSASVVLRCILIPGVNDVMRHSEEIAGLQERMPCISGVDIMPLHGFASAKYADLGMDVPDVYNNVASEKDVERWMELLGRCGVRNVKKG